MRIAEGSKEYIEKVTKQLNQAWTRSELDGLCQTKYGINFTYDDETGLCIDHQNKPTMTLPVEKEVEPTRIYMKPGGDDLTDDEKVSHADRKGTGSLRGTMVHRSVKTLTGKGVVSDKEDQKEG